MSKNTHTEEAVVYAKKLREVIVSMSKQDVPASQTKLSNLLDFVKNNETLNKNSTVLTEVGGLCVDIGFDSRNENLIDEGVQFMRRSQGIKNSAINHYNLANAYDCFYKLSNLRKIREKKIFYPFQDFNYLEKAKTEIREALKTERSEQFLTNYANYLDVVGRYSEALGIYREVLHKNPNFGMAQGNLGQVLFTLASQFSSRELLDESIPLLRRSINNPNTARFGGGAAISSFQNTLKNALALQDLLIKEKFDKHVPYKEDEMLKMERTFIEFCVNNDLFVNVHYGNKNCVNAIRDDIFISLITKTLDHSAYFKLAQKVNSIKESYAVARLLLYLSTHPTNSISKISSITLLASIPDYSLSNLYTGLLKAAYKECFGVLDKIAFFIDEYEDLGLVQNNTQFYYHNFWFEELKKNNSIRKEFLMSRDRYLYTIFSIMNDSVMFQRKTLRNNLTHSDVVLYWPDGILDDDERKMGYKELFLECLDLFKIVKHAIIALCVYVNAKEERKKVDGGIYPPILVDTRQNFAPSEFFD